MGRNSKKTAYQIAFDITKEILEEEKRPLNPNQIYDLAIQKGYGDRIAYGGKTPKSSFARDIYINLRFDPNTIFEVVQEKPKKLIKLKGQKIEDNSIDSNHLSDTNGNENKKENDCIERSLHPLLVTFIKNNGNFAAFAKTIYHENSTKETKGKNKWIHPDIVGISFEYIAWNFTNELRGFIQNFDRLPIKIYSFELKQELTMTNFRESYFQAVSNSSWANEGYLVAAEIKFDDAGALMSLIERTNQSFGIGVIHLNIENPEDSQILFPAQFKPNLDYIMMNELSKVNKDFDKFLNTIYKYDKENEHRFERDFDEILDEDKLENHIKELKKLMNK